LAYSQKARVEAGTHTNPEQQGGSCGAPHSPPRGVHLPATPEPLRATDCGLPAALSLTLSVALRVPDAVGLNVTVMLQLAPAANELPQV